MSIRIDANLEHLHATFTGAAGAWTLTMWVKRITDTNTWTSVGGLWTGSGNNGHHFHSTSTGGDDQRFYDGSFRGTAVDFDGPAGTDTDWQFLAFAVDASGNGVIYDRLDAESTLTSSSWSGGANGTINELVVGSYANSVSNRYINGEIVSVKLWKAQLSESEVLTESNNLSAQRATNLFGEWHLTDSADLSDQSGGGAGDLTQASTGSVSDGASDPSSMSMGGATLTASLLSPVTAPTATVAAGAVTLAASLLSPATHLGATIAPRYTLAAGLLSPAVHPTATVVPGAATVAAALLSPAVHPAATISQGGAPQTLTAALLAAATHPGATVTPGYTLAAGLLSPAVHPTAVVTVAGGAQTLAAGLLSPAAHPTGNVAAGAVAIVAGLLSPAALPAATVSPGNTVAAGLLSPATHPTATVTAGAVVLAASLLSPATHPTATLAASYTLAAGLLSPATHPTAVVAVGAATIIAALLDAVTFPSGDVVLVGVGVVGSGAVTYGDLTGSGSVPTGGLVGS